MEVLLRPMVAPPPPKKNLFFKHIQTILTPKAFQKQSAYPTQPKQSAYPRQPKQSAYPRQPKQSAYP